jgi:hypothetical protein
MPIATVARRRRRRRRGKIYDSILALFLGFFRDRITILPL